MNIYLAKIFSVEQEKNIDLGVPVWAVFPDGNDEKLEAKNLCKKIYNQYIQTTNNE